MWPRGREVFPARVIPRVVASRYFSRDIFYQIPVVKL